MLKSAMKSSWGRIAMAIVGPLIYAFGINLFVVPLGLFTGGMMGFSQLVRSVILMVIHKESFTYDIAGIIYYAINVPLLLVTYRALGRVFFRNTGHKISNLR